MSGPVMVIGGEIKFHPECFKCDHCSSIIGDDESYAYVDQCKLYCSQCFRLRVNTDDEDGMENERSAVRFQNKPPPSMDNGNNRQSSTNVIEMCPSSNGRQRRIRVAMREHCPQHSTSKRINVQLFNNGKLLSTLYVNNLYIIIIEFYVQIVRLIHVRVFNVKYNELII